jgi:uncharacterized protein YbjT (DUF2867 family)
MRLMANTPVILVLGATGKVGSRVARLLEGHHVEIKRASPTGSDVRFDWDDGSTWDAALKGVDRIYLIGPLMRTHFAPDVGRFLDQAEASGASHVSYISLYGAESNPSNPGVREVELDLMARPNLGHSLIRPAWYMQNFSEFFLMPINGAIVVPTGDGREAFIDVDDVAAVAAATLMDPVAHRGAAYSITGPDALTVAEAAAVISKVSGSHISHVSTAQEEWVSAILATGVPPEYGQVLRRLSNAVASGNGSLPNKVVKEVTGREPTTFAEFAEHNAAAWQAKSQELTQGPV